MKHCSHTEQAPTHSKASAVFGPLHKSLLGAHFFADPPPPTQVELPGLKVSELLVMSRPAFPSPGQIILGEGFCSHLVRRDFCA